MRGRRQQIQPELQRILAGRVRELVDERLEDERERVAARRAQGAGRHAERHQRRLEREVRDEARRKLGRPECCAECRRTAAPSPKLTKWFCHATSFPAASTPPLRKWKPAGPVEVVTHVVFARPQQLHRRAADAFAIHAASTM